MDNNKHQTDKSLMSINEKISFFEEQKNRIKDLLPAGSRVKMADMEEDKLKSIPEVEENTVEENTVTENKREETYSLHLHKDDNGSLGLKIAKRGNATYVIGFTSNENPGVTIGDQLVRVGVNSVDGKPLGEIARMMRAAISPVSVTFKSLKGNKQLVSQVLSLQNAKLKMRKALRRATAMGLVNEALSSRRKSKAHSLDESEKLQEKITPQQKVPENKVRHDESNDNASDSSIASKDSERSELGNDMPAPDTAEASEAPKAVLPIKEQNQVKIIGTSDGAFSKTNNPFSNIPEVDEEVISAHISEVVATTAKRSSPISQELSIEKWPSPINFTMKSFVSNESSKISKDDPAKEKIIALELEVQRLNKLRTKTLVAHDVELARFQSRIDDAHSMVNDAKDMHISYKKEVEEAKKRSKEKEMELNLCKRKCERIEKENQALHEKLIRAQQDQAQTKEELQRLKISHNQFQNEHQKLVHYLNSYRDTKMHNYASNNPTTALSLARGETPRLRHRDISFEALTVPEGNITFSPSRYSSHSQVPSTPVSQSRTLSMLLQGEKIQDATDIHEASGKAEISKNDNWY